MSTSFFLEHFGLGARVFATRHSGVCNADEPGLVVELYELNGRPGRTILFAGGGYDGFSPDELATFVHPLGSVDTKIAGYRFTGVSRLSEDLRRGIFDFDAFPPFSSWFAEREKLSIAASCPPSKRHRGPGRI